MKDYDVNSESPEPGLEVFTLEFVQDRKGELPQVQESLETGSHDILHEMTHKWIGFSKPYGFDWLAKAASELKNLARSGDVEDAKGVIKQISCYLDDKETFIKNNY